MGIDTTRGNPNMDYVQHTHTYNAFLKLTTVTVVFLVALLLAMKFFLV